LATGETAEAPQKFSDASAAQAMEPWALTAEIAARPGNPNPLRLAAFEVPNLEHKPLDANFGDVPPF
jgi:hypothetical protein